MFKCKACPCKDSHIQDLRKEIEFLKRINLPQVSLPVFDSDTNFMLNGAGDIRPEDNSVETELIEQADEARKEQDRILSGNYDNY